MRSHKDMFTFTRLMFRAGLDSQYIEDKHLQKEPLKKWILSHMLIYRRRYKAAQWLPLTQFFLLPAPFSFLTSFRSLIKSHLPRKPVLVTLRKTPHLYQPTWRMSFPGSVLHSPQPVSTYQDSMYFLLFICIPPNIGWMGQALFSVPSTEHNNQHIVDNKYLLLERMSNRYGHDRTQFPENGCNPSEW